MKQKRHSSRDASSMAVGKQHHELRSNSIYDKTPILEAWKHLSMVPSARWVSANGRQEEETLKPPTFIAETRLGAFSRTDGLFAAPGRSYTSTNMG